MTGMDIRIFSTFLPHNDADAALAFYRDTLGFFSGAEIMQEPVDQQWGSRDCAVRDPAGNTVRIQQVS